MANTQYSRYNVYIKQIIGNKYMKSTAPYIFSVLATIIFIIFAIRPTILTIIGLQKTIQDNQQTLNILEQKAKDLTEGKRNLDNLDPAVKTKISTRLPDRSEVTTLINDLQIAASQSATISALQIQPVTVYNNVPDNLPKQNTVEVLFSLNLQGPYSQLLLSLDNISKIPRLINITSAMLNKSMDEVIGLSISGKAYYLKE